MHAGLRPNLRFGIFLRMYIYENRAKNNFPTNFKIVLYYLSIIDPTDLCIKIKLSLGFGVFYFILFHFNFFLFLFLKKHNVLSKCALPPPAILCPIISNIELEALLDRDSLCKRFIESCAKLDLAYQVTIPEQNSSS